MECGTWRSGRIGGAAGLETLGWRRRLDPGGREAALRGEKAALGDEEAVGCDAEAGVVVKAAPATPLVVAEADLLFELLVVALDKPARLGGVGQPLERGRGWQVGEPVFGGLGLALGPLDQQPLLWPGLGAPGVAVRRSDPQDSKAGGQQRLAAFTPAHRAPGALGQPCRQRCQGEGLLAGRALQAG